MVIVVTGGSGFVGRNLVQHLRDVGHEVHAPSRAELELRDEAAVRRYLRAVGADTVVHAAGKVGGIAANIADPVGFYVENVLTGIAVVRAADSVGVSRLLNLASSCVYPKDRDRLYESDLLTGPLEPTNEGYALAKIAVVRLCEWIAQRSSDRLYRNLFPSNLYGPYDHFGSPSAHLLAAALTKADDALRIGADTLEIWGDGQARREFMHVQDLCECVAFLLPMLETIPSSLNVGPGIDHTVDEYYASAARAVGWEGSFRHDLTRPVGMRRKLLDVTRLSEIGFSTRIELDEGVADTYRWLVDSRQPRGGAESSRLRLVTPPAAPSVTYPLAFDTWGGREEAALDGVISSRRFTMGARVRDFEREFAEYLGVRHCIMVNSGSSANLLMAAALPFRSDGAVPVGAEIVVPAVGWATTYFPFTQNGYKLRFADVDPDTLNIDPQRLAEALSPETAAVCVVNTLGNPCDFAAIETALTEAGRRFGREIILLEDNCEAMGATVGGRACGSFGLAGTFSFFFSHHISTMEGGMVCTDDDDFAEIVTCLRAHGWTRDLPHHSRLAVPAPDPFEDAFRFVLPGYNLRPLELSAVAGSVQLGRFPEFLAHRRANALHWRAELAPYAADFRIQEQPESGSWFGLSVLVEAGRGLGRKEVVAALSDAGVMCRPIISGNFTRQPVMSRLDHTVCGPLPGADMIHDNGFYVGNAAQDLMTEIDTVTDVLAKLSRRAERTSEMVA
jgi:CDP-4-dehydro-6-deoxyglucose reductase, E1